MTKDRLIGMFMFVVVLVGFGQPVLCQDVDPRREPATAIKEAIRLLERNEHAAFVKAFIRPSELEELLVKYGTIEAVATEFLRNDRAAKMLEILRTAAALTPTIDATGRRADYRFDKPVGGASRLVLSKIGDYWYLRD